MSFSKKPKRVNPDEVDPSVYYYDEVYDDMKDDQDSPSCSSVNKDKPKGSKYIKGLQETAELRKTENELRRFKNYARDREEARGEGEYCDKDVFMTSAYKRKLEEMKKLEDEKSRSLEQERSKSMNFLRSAKVTHKDHSGIKAGTSKDSHKSPSEIRGRECDKQGYDTTALDSQRQPPKRRLKTLEDRREYLREILAKRTVGKVYEEAVQRYIKRKSLMQN